MKIKPTLMLNLNCAEGRAYIQPDIEAMSADELNFLLRVLRLGKEGTNIEFSVKGLGDGRFNINFIVGEVAIKQ